MPLIALSPRRRASYQSLILADNPIAYWRGNDTSGPLVDVSGNGFSATENGAAATLDEFVDEIAIYNTVLSPATVLAHYNAGI